MTHYDKDWIFRRSLMQEQKVRAPHTSRLVQVPLLSRGFLFIYCNRVTSPRSFPIQEGQVVGQVLDTQLSKKGEEASQLPITTETTPPRRRFSSSSPSNFASPNWKRGGEQKNEPTTIIKRPRRRRHKSWFSETKHDSMPLPHLVLLLAWHWSSFHVCWSINNRFFY